MITIKRSTGELISGTPLAQEQSDKAWEVIVQEYLRRHPDALQANTHSPDVQNENPDRLEI